MEKILIFIVELTNEDGTWKISKGTIIGRCGLTYSIK